MPQISPWFRNNVPVSIAKYLPGGSVTTDWLVATIPLSELMHDPNATQPLGVGLSSGRWEGWDVNAWAVGNISKSCGDWFKSGAAQLPDCAPVFVDEVVAYRDEAFAASAPEAVMCANAHALFDTLGDRPLSVAPTPLPVSQALSGKSTNVTLRSITRTKRACTSVRPMMRMVCVDDAQPWAVGDGGWPLPTVFRLFHC